ncbi:MAG TPA: c-type cytochrome [Gaiellaceae bacterium]|nr:c-type cytochrome [Gaiellaceae bacterium]
MRRLAPFLAIAFILAGCGGSGTVLPTAETVIGTVPTTSQASVPTGDPAAGKTLFASNGCGGCHVFTPAGSHGTVGPDLDKLDQYAKQANSGPTATFAFTSIKNPAAYVQPGYPNVMPNFGQTLKDKQIADLVAFLTAKG